MTVWKEVELPFGLGGSWVGEGEARLLPLSPIRRAVHEDWIAKIYFRCLPSQLVHTQG